MIGKRIYGYAGDGIPAAGEYGKDDRNGQWFAMCPNDMLANLAHHEVTEHEDGTITVSPSIHVTQPNAGEYHGYLKRGVWSDA